MENIDKAYEIIKSWPLKEGYVELMNYVRENWWSPEWGWKQETREEAYGESAVLYNISTGGWSDNEYLISALEANSVFMGICWESSRRGGHYVFMIPSWAQDPKLNIEDLVF